jgi:hypothetical protein
MRSRGIDTVRSKSAPIRVRIKRAKSAGMPHGPAIAERRHRCMIEQKTLAADMIFWAVITLPVVVFGTAKIANYALHCVKRKRID